MSEGPPPHLRLAGGIVAYNDVDHLGSAVDSLLSQRLPDGVAWSGLWLVVSPSEDGTVELARSLARADPRIRLIEEPARRGKSAALREVMTHAEGDAVVLLNGDAFAEPGSVAAILAARPELEGPYAVMARPVPSSQGHAPLDRAVQLMWEVHHAFHLHVLSNGEGSHLSDEMLLLPLGQIPPLGEGIITDGAFVGRWLRANGGSLSYAPGAGVTVTVPASLREHLVQRRRIHRGHRQVGQMTGSFPSTLQRWGLRRPAEAIKLVWQSARRNPRPALSLSALLLIESLGGLLAGWDAVTGRGEPAAWERIRGRPWERVSSVPRDEPLT